MLENALRPHLVWCYGILLRGSLEILQFASPVDILDSSWNEDEPPTDEFIQKPNFSE
jgi:hypothetical protein